MDDSEVNFCVMIYFDIKLTIFVRFGCQSSVFYINVCPWLLFFLLDIIFSVPLDLRNLIIPLVSSYFS